MHLEAVTHICRLTQGNPFEANCFEVNEEPKWAIHGEERALYFENSVVNTAVKFNLLSEDNTRVIFIVLTDF